MKVTNLSSGSKGNCTVVQNSTTVLVDIGLNYKNLQSSLSQIDVSAENIDALLITHEHSDHIFGIESLIKKQPHIHVYAHPLVWEQVTKKYPSLKNFANIHNFTYNIAFSVGDFTVYPMENFHDSVSCASFIISCGGGKLGICTDLGIITENQIDMLSTCKVVYLECNHDKLMLKNCSYPQILKNRISSKYGHLSNDQCATAVVRLTQKQTKVVVLSHISQNSNLPEVAYGRVMDELQLAGKEDTLVLLGYQNKVGKTITIT